MKKATLLALAAFITELANNECGGTETVSETAAGSTAEPTEKKRRGRPPGAATPPEPVTGEQTQAPAEPAKQPDKPKLTEEEAEANYQKLRGVIEPYVKGNWTEPAQPKGPEVKKIIAKYAPETGSLKELANFPEKHADFQRDIEALGY